MSQSKHSDDHEISRVIREMKRAYDRGDNAIDISKIETGRDSKMVKLDFTPMRDE
jgi:hypothetical protein